MKKLTKIAVTGRKKGSYKQVTGPYSWDNAKLVFEKEEPRKKIKTG
jgi:hypothetical protein